MLHDKTTNVTKNPKYYGYQRGIASVVKNFFDKKFPGANTSGGAVVSANKFSIKSEMIPNQKLAQELHKPVIKEFGRREV